MPSNAPSHQDYRQFEEAFNKSALEHISARTVAEEQVERTLKPVVIVGLGGTGCEIAARLRKSLNKYYRNLDFASGMIQYVMLDTLPLQNHESTLVRESFSDGSEYRFLGGFSPSSVIASFSPKEPALKRWWNTGYSSASSTLSSGCSRVRQLGRLCLYYHRTMVANTIQTAIDRARSLNERAVRDLTLPSVPARQDVSFVVITGTCGGTGSGMFLDACHLVYRAAEQAGLVDPNIRAVLVAPTLHVNRGRASYQRTGDAYQANGFAFFKELHHFILHGADWNTYCMDAEERIQGQQTPLRQDWEPARRFYIIDNLVAGNILPDLAQVYTLAADGLFHLLATPVGANEEGVSVNSDGALGQKTNGKSHKFSSFGVSYLIYPSMTIARSAAGRFLRDLIDFHMLRSLTDNDRKRAVERANELFVNNAGLLDAANIAAELTQATSGSQKSVPQASSLERSAANKASGKGAYNAAEEASRTTESLCTDAAATIQSNCQEMRSTRLGKLQELVNSELNSGKSTSIYFSQQVFRELSMKVAAAEPPHYVAPSSAGQTRSVETEEQCKRVIQQIEKDFIPDVLQKRKLNENLRTLASCLSRRFAASVSEASAQSVREYRGEVLKILAEAVSGCERAVPELQAIRSALDDHANEVDPSHDESLLVATAQLVPAGGIRGAAQSLADNMRGGTPDSEGNRPSEEALKAAELYVQLGSQHLFSKLSGSDDKARALARQSIIDTSVKWVFSRPQMQTAVRRGLAEALRDEVDAEDLTQRVLPNVLALSDASWQLDLTRAAMRNEEIVTIHSVAMPAAMRSTESEITLPAALQEYIAGRTSKPLDNRRMMVLQTQHGAPLQTVIGMDALRSTYNRWVHDANLRGPEPPHIDQRWNAGTFLEEVYADLYGVSDKVVRAFAIGNFTDWLVNDKKDARALGLITGFKEQGCVFARGLSAYYVLELEETGGKLRRKGQRKLSDKGRAAAAEAFDEAAQKAVVLYESRLDELLSPHEKSELLEEYIKVLDTQIDKATTPELERQLRAERQAILVSLQAQ